MSGAFGARPQAGRRLCRLRLVPVQRYPAEQSPRVTKRTHLILDAPTGSEPQASRRLQIDRTVPGSGPGSCSVSATVRPAPQQGRGPRPRRPSSGASGRGLVWQLRAATAGTRRVALGNGVRSEARRKRGDLGVAVA